MYSPRSRFQVKTTDCIVWLHLASWQLSRNCLCCVLQLGGGWGGVPGATTHTHHPQIIGMQLCYSSLQMKALRQGNAQLEAVLSASAACFPLWSQETFSALCQLLKNKRGKHSGLQDFQASRQLIQTSGPALTSQATELVRTASFLIHPVRNTSTATGWKEQASLRQYFWSKLG
jgi:hypothetical protein